MEMRQRYWVALGLIIGLGGMAVAQAPGFINQYNALCSASFPSRCVAVTAAGEVPITGTISASSAATATAADPAYVEGTSNAFSQDLSGHLRTVTTIGSLAAGTNIIGKVGIDQTTPGTTNGVQVNAALPAGANVIGHVIADTGSTTAVTGNVTVVQPTGTNLHVVADATSTTAVTQATASNLNATVVGTGTFADQPAGSVAHDGVGTGVNPLLEGGYASAAAPSDVSADGDAVRGWRLRNGAAAAVLTAAGALIGGDAANGLDVDVTRLPALVAGAAIIGKVGIDQTTPGTTNLVQVTDGSGALNVIVDSITAGSNVIGKVSIDQTTPGTTNLVQVTDGSGALNTIVDSGTITTVSTVTAVTAITNALPAGTNTVGNVVLVPSASAGGTTLYTLTLAASTNATNVKASAGQLYSISGFNMSSATPIWISLYNNSGTPTCGTSIIQQFMIPGSTTGTGFVYDFSAPKGFSSGIAFCATTGIAGTGNAAASTYVLNIDYK